VSRSLTGGEGRKKTGGEGKVLLGENYLKKDPPSQSGVKVIQGKVGRLTQKKREGVDQHQPNWTDSRAPGKRTAQGQSNLPRLQPTERRITVFGGGGFSGSKGMLCWLNL